ncbi:MAG: hypothetical protein JW987_08985 [Anaerolineaceae bacterium]|nr:hypothetical protein [Anaerolineaceae bacterium]
MKFDIGMTVVILSIVIFYIRLIQLRGRRKQERRAEELQRMKAPRKPKGEVPAPAGPQPMIKIASWWLVGTGALVMLAGLLLRSSHELIPVLGPFWWAVMAVGVLIFTFSLK